MPLYLNDMIKLNGYDPNDFILIRHSTSDKNFKECYKAKYIKEYTQLQKPDFAKNYQYWMVFISDDKTTARYLLHTKLWGTEVLAAMICLTDFLYRKCLTTEHNIS